MDHPVKSEDKGDNEDNPSPEERHSGIHTLYPFYEPSAKTICTTPLSRTTIQTTSFSISVTNSPERSGRQEMANVVSRGRETSRSHKIGFARP